MAENSKIEWTDHTFNPWWGCTKVGPGCDHCYAEALDKRTGGTHWGTGAPRRRTKDWSGPRRWNKHAGHYEALHGRRQRVFCASMADVFDNEVPDEWRADLWQLIRECPRLEWQIVTKRIGNAAKMLPSDWPFPHVGLLATIVNQAEADRDVPKLLATPAAWRGISAEPLLGPIDFTRAGRNDAGAIATALEPHEVAGLVGNCVGVIPSLDWVIVGGESGPGARPMDRAWASSIVSQCRAAGVPVFVKQMGANVTDRNDAGFDGCDASEWPEHIASEDRIEENLDGFRDGYQGAPVRIRLRHRKGADVAEWPEELRVRQMPAAQREKVLA